MSEGYLEGIGRVSGWLLKVIWNVSGGYLESVGKVPGKSRDSVWKQSERCLESIEIFLSVWDILGEFFAGSVSIIKFCQIPLRTCRSVTSFPITQQEQ